MENPLKDEWNLIWLPNHKLLDIVHKDDLSKIKLEFDVMFYGNSKQELLENFIKELNRFEKLHRTNFFDHNSISFYVGSNQDIEYKSLRDVLAAFSFTEISNEFALQIMQTFKTINSSKTYCKFFEILEAVYFDEDEE